MLYLFINSGSFNLFWKHCGICPIYPLHTTKIQNWTTQLNKMKQSIKDTILQTEQNSVSNWCLSEFRIFWWRVLSVLLGTR